MTFFLILLAGLQWGCTAPGRFIKAEDDDIADQRPADSLITFRIYLVGDTGEPPEVGQGPLLTLLENQLSREDTNSAIVFLGDNLYPSGLYEVGHPERPEGEERLNKQLQALRNFKGRVVFVPGNHDWGQGGIGGSRTQLGREENYIENALDRGNTFLPDNGFPGPVDVELNDDIVLVALDTQWWLEPIKTYGNTGQYELENEGEFLLQLHNILQHHATRRLVVVGHHPVFTNSSHGGRFAFRRWLFSPLSLFARRFLGTPQDISNLKYRRLRQGMQDIFERHRNLVYAAGHDHNLQYFIHDQQHYIVSGSGSKLDDVFGGFGSSFTKSVPGFATITYYADGSEWVAFWAPEGDGSTGRSLYVNRMVEGVQPTVEPPPIVQERTEGDSTTAHPGTAGEPAGAPSAPYAFYSTGTVKMPAIAELEPRPLLKGLLGEQYRNIWITPVEVPVMDMQRTAGGLTAGRIGGGLQTMSLRLNGGDGDEYQLRSVSKDPRPGIPSDIRRTVAQDVVADQMSAMHPYGALIIPRLADSIGIFHTAPRLVQVPDSPRLEQYQDRFKEQMVLLEARPDENQADEAQFGHATNVVGSPKLFEEIEQDNDRIVDPYAFARARLLDMLIGDWDRHADQWRWAEFENDSLRTYKPIPRDRDMAFFRFDGPLARLAQLSGIGSFRRFINFSDEYSDLTGLNFNGMPLDRRFLAPLTEDHWVRVADSIRVQLTDETIDAALRDWPEAIYNKQGAEFNRILQARRDALPDLARRYYRYLAYEPQIVGSNKHERFEVTRLNDKETRVVVFKIQKEGAIQRELYRRTFTTEETDEVHLYGLDGNDQFVVRGTARRGMRIRAIGAGGDDLYVDSSLVRGPARKVFFYDTRNGNRFITRRTTTVSLSDEPFQNEYRMQRIEHDALVPKVTLAYNSEDGFLPEAGIGIVKRGFQKYPYAAYHRITARYATAFGAFDLRYHGNLIRTSLNWDVVMNGQARAERDIRNFYGLGNETRRSDRDRYHADMGRVEFAAIAVKPIFPFTRLGVGPRFEFTNIDPRGGFTTETSGFTGRELTDSYFLGPQIELDVNGTDTLAGHQSGVSWKNIASLNVGIRNVQHVYARISTDLRYYYTFDAPLRTTLALRIGGATNIGRMLFYQAHTLGGTQNLRGYGRNRFAGRSSYYTNVDLRVKLTDFSAYFSRGDLGVLFFVDQGRVWMDRERSSRWYQGYGGGIWISPFYRTVINTSVGFSREDTIFDVRFGFQF